MMLINNLSDSTSIEIVNLKIPLRLWFYRCIFKKMVNISRFIIIKLLTPTLFTSFTRGLYITKYIYIYIYIYIFYYDIIWYDIHTYLRIFKIHVCFKTVLFCFVTADIQWSSRLSRPSRTRQGPRPEAVAFHRSPRGTSSPGSSENVAGKATEIQCQSMEKGWNRCKW